MTTKEFVRRRDSFSLLDTCPYLVSSLIVRCFKITLITRLNESQVVFSEFLDFDSLNKGLLDFADSVYFEFYSFNQFNIDLGFFRSFLSRLSSYQLESLKLSHKCDNLLRYIDLNNGNTK